MARRTTKRGATRVADYPEPRTQEEILGDSLVINVTDEERRQFFQWVRDFSGSRKLGPPGVRACYYHLRDKPWSFIRPDYEIKNPDGSTRKQVQWSRWVKVNLIAARKLWLAGDRGHGAIDPDMLDDDGSPDIQGWATHDRVEEWADSIPKLQLDPWEGQANRVLVLCEKTGMRGIVQSACRPTRADFMCTRGDATMKQKSNCGKWAANVKAQGLEPVVLYAGDHDMQGVNMDKTWVRDVAEIDSVTRVAITLEQARERELPMESAKDKMHFGSSLSAARKGQNEKIQKYIDRHGPDMIELNALVVDSEFDLRNIIREAIDEHIDRDVWDEREGATEGPTERVGELIEQLRDELEETDE
jgi:hypothetical protein